MWTIWSRSTWFTVALSCLSPNIRAAAPLVEINGPGVTLKVLERTTAPVLKSDKPWESFCINPCTVIREGNTWRMWYECFDSDYKSDNDAYYCYAESKDGVRWEKPDLGIVEYKGSKQNNIIVAGPAVGGLHGESVFLDPAAPPAERYKLVYVKMVRQPPSMDFTAANKDWEIRGGVSSDGIRWRMLDRPLLTRLSDTQHVCFRDGDVYRLYMRMWRTDGRGPGDNRRRTVGHTKSRTFGDFPQPTEILRPDEQDPPDVDFYNSAAAKLRDDLYLMFPAAFAHDSDLVVPQVAFSCDGEHFLRPDRQPVLPLGKGFDSKGIYVSPGAIPADKPDRYWIYYAGHDFKHGEALPNLIRKRGGVGRALIEVKGRLDLAD